MNQNLWLEARDATSAYIDVTMRVAELVKAGDDPGLSVGIAAGSMDTLVSVLMSMREAYAMMASKMDGVGAGRLSKPSYDRYGAPPRNGRGPL